MILPGKLKILFKTVSALMAGIFLFQQVAWAGDLVDAALQKQYNEQSQTFAPSYLQSQQSTQENLISQKQDIENFTTNQTAVASSTATTEGDLALQGPRGGGSAPLAASSQLLGLSDSPVLNLENGAAPTDGAVVSVTTSAGDIIRYKNNAIYEIQKLNGPLIKNIVLTAIGGLLDADITYPDTTIETVRGGKVIRIKKPDKTVYYYDNNELVKYVVYPGAVLDKYTISEYSYEKSGDNITKVIVTDFVDISGPIDGKDSIAPLLDGKTAQKISYYNSQNKLTKVENKAGKKTIEYDSIGALYKVTDETYGKTYIYQNIPNADKTKYTVSLQAIVLTAPDLSGAIAYKYEYFGKGADITIAEDTTWPEGTYNFNSIIIASGKTFTIKGNSYVYTNLSVSGGGNLRVESGKFSAKSIVAKTLTIGAGSTITIAPIPGGPLAGSTQPNSSSTPPESVDTVCVVTGYANADFTGFAGVQVYNVSTAKVLPDVADPYFDAIVYGSDGSVEEIRKPNGQIIKYSEVKDQQNQENNKLIIEILGNTYTCPLSANDNIEGVTVDIGSDIKAIYNQYGKISTVKSAQDGLTFGFSEDGKVSRIEKDDGTIIEGATFYEDGDDKGKIRNATITRPDGVVATYTEGKLISIEQPDGSVFEYDGSGAIKKYSKPGVVFVYTTDVEDNTVGEVSESDNMKDEDVVYQKYNQAHKLIQLKKKSGEILDYSYNDPSASIVVTSTIVKTDKTLKTVTKYDANNNITRTEIYPTTEDPKYIVSMYEYGRIRDVYKSAELKDSYAVAELIYRYGYEFDDAGKEITVITDVAAQDIKRYKDGLLISVTDKNNLITTYEYNADKTIKKSVVTRLGKLINQYEYTYSGSGESALTTIEDIDHIKRTYNKNNEMVSLEENGRTYEYHYLTDGGGKKYTTQELIKVVDETNNVTHYKDGKIDYIEMADGSKVKDFITVDDTTTGYVIEKSGVKYYVEDGRVVKEIRMDKTEIEYYPNGWAKSMKAPDGTVTNYDYEVADTANLGLADGINDNVKLINTAAEKALELDTYPDPGDTLLLHFNGANGATSTTDSSVNPHPVTFNGDAHIDTANGRFGSSGIALDGNGDYVSIAPSEDWHFGTGLFTVDLWVNFNDLNNYPVLWSQVFTTSLRRYLIYNNDSKTLCFAHLNTNTHTVSITAPFSPSLSTWYHIALVRKGSSNDSSDWMIAINGVPQPLTLWYGSWNGDLPNISSPFNIGCYGGTGTPPSAFLNGRIDEFRVSKGLARWSSDFSSELPTAEYHGLYKASGSFTSSSVALNATNISSLSWNESIPAGSGAKVKVEIRTGNSPDLDSVGWTEVTSGTQLAASSAAKYLQYRVTMTSSTDSLMTPKLLPFSDGSFIKIDYTKNYGEVLGANINGIKDNVALLTASGKKYLELTSYPDPANKLLLHLNGANGTAATTDNSANPHPVTFVGNAHLDTSSARFGSSAVAFDGSGDYLTLPDSDDWNFGTDSFTMDFWVKWNSLPSEGQVQNLLNQRPGGWGLWMLNIGKTGETYFYSLQSRSGDGVYPLDHGFISSGLVAGTWYHIALVRQGDVFKLFQNGQQQDADYVSSGSMQDVESPLQIGGLPFSGYYLNGSMDELRISKGVARWSSDFSSKLPIAEYHDPYKTTGSFISDPILVDAVKLNTISWNENKPVGTDIKVYVRTGDSSNTNDSSWTQWSAALTNSSGSDISSLAAKKYIQYRIDMAASSDLKNTPQILLSGDSPVAISYVSKNSLNDNVVGAPAASGIRLDPALTPQLNKYIQFYTSAHKEIVGYTIEKSDGDYSVENDHVVKAIKDDGTEIEYYANGWAKSLKKPGEDIIYYDYEVADTANLGLADGINDNVKLINTAAEKTLELNTYPDPSNTLLLHFNGTNGATSAIDSSFNACPITFKGDAHLDTSNAKFGSSAMAFDGSGDYLTIPDSNDWNFGTGNFTIDFWVKVGALPAPGVNQFIAGQWSDVSHYWDIALCGAGGNPTWFFQSDNASGAMNMIRTPAEIKANTWYHMAFVRSENIIKIFVDGVQLGAAESYSQAFPDSGDTLTLGVDPYDNAGSFFNGYIDEFRISKGVVRDFSGGVPVAEYPSLYKTTGSFTSSSVALNATNISSLSWNESIPAGSGAKVKVEIRTGNSPDLDSVGWTEVTSGTQLAASSAAKYLQYRVTMTSSTDSLMTPKLLPFSDGSFIKIDYTKNYGEVLDANINGIKDNVALLTASGKKYLELMSYPDTNQQLLLHFNGNDNSINPTHPITFNGNAYLDTSNAKFGSSAIALDGNGDYVSIAPSEDWHFGTGLFTVDLWVNFNDLNNNPILWSQVYSNTLRRYLVYKDSTKTLEFTHLNTNTPTVSITAPFSASINTWYHIALVRKASNNNADDWMITVNGVPKVLTLESGAWNGDIPDVAASPLYIGCYGGGAPCNFLNGRIDEFRVSKGLARWSSDFSSELPNAEYHDPYKTTGSFTSDPILVDAVKLNTISWNENKPAGTDIKVYVRTGDSSNTNDSSWTGWSTALTNSSGSDISSLAAKKYIQYRIDMAASSDLKNTPQILLSGDSPVSISYVKKDTGNINDVTYIVAEKGDTKYKYDKDGLLKSVMYPDSRVINCLYTPADPAVLNGFEMIENGIHYIYNADKKLIKVLDKNGMEYNYNYTQDQGNINFSGFVKNSTLDISQFTKNNIAFISNDFMLSTHPDSAALLLHLNDNFNDASGKTPNYIIGNARIDQTQHEFGNGSGLFDADGTSIRFADSNDWNFGTGDFTIDFWIKFKEGQVGGNLLNGIMLQATDGNNIWLIRRYMNKWTLYKNFNANTNFEFGFDSSVSDLTWYHVAFVRNGNTITAYQNGVSLGSMDCAGLAMPDIAADLIIGHDNSGPAYSTKGWLDEVRITKGTALWSNNFTPPQREYSNTLYNNSGSVMSGAIPVNATEFGYILANADTANGTTIRFQTRTGDSPDTSTWTDSWSEATKDAAGYKINSSVNKYIQYQAILETTDITTSPIISSNGDYAVKLTYSYNKTFDANTPPADVPFKDYLKLNTPSVPALSTELCFDISQIENMISDAVIPADTPIQSKTFEANLVSKITLPDGTVVKYYNDKPISILKAGSFSIDNIVLEKINGAFHDYRVESGVLISYNDTAADNFILSFTATNAANDTYIFKDNKLAQIKHADGTIVDNPTPDAFSIQVLKLAKDAFSPKEFAAGHSVTPEYKSANIALNITKDGRVTYTIDNKIASVYQRHDDGRIDLLMDYSYDETGNLILIRLPYARDSLDSQIVAARQKMAEEKANYLKTLAEQKGLAYQQIAANVEAVRKQINDERAHLRPMLYQEVTRVTQGCFGPQYYRETVEVPEVRNALNQLDEQEHILNEEAAKAYRDLGTQISDAESQLTADETNSLNQIALQEKSFQAAMIEEESLPVILECYRSILGRDPDDTETKYWLAKIDYRSKINVNELKGSLESSTELAEQNSFINDASDGIKKRIKDALGDYLNPATRDSLILSLGLNADNVVALDQNEVKAIIDFLDRQNIHFGRSAFVSLFELLKENGKVPGGLDSAGLIEFKKQLAVKSILIDILTGTINALSEGKLLELSMYSLSKTASLPEYGLTLYNTKLEYADLVQAFNSTGKLIAHLKNNHFVVVTNITTDEKGIVKITYKELNRGKDGYSWTVSKDDFIKSWTGYTITKEDPNNITRPDGTKPQRLDDFTAMRIKGSCLELLVILVGMFVGAVTSVATAVVGAIGVIVASISAVLGPIIAGIGALITNIAGFMVGVGNLIFQAVQFVGLSLIPNIGGWLGGIGSWLGGIGSAIFGGSGLGGIISATGFNLTGLGFAIGKTVVVTALSIGVSKGLELIGLDPMVSSLISSFVTGGVSGLFNSFSVAGFLAGGLQGLAVQGANVIGNAIGLPPQISSLIGMTAGSLIGAGLNGIKVPIDPGNLELGYKILIQPGLDAVSYALNTTILPNVASELAYYGVGKLGEMLGVDPRISQLAGIGIRSSINAGLTDGWSAQSIWNGIKNGLIQGITNVSLDFVSQIFNINPLLTELGFNTIASAISGLMSAWSSNAPPIESMFSSIVSGWQSATLNLFRLGLQDPNNVWQQAAYIANVKNFADIIKNGGSGFDGLINAMSTYASSMLRAGTVQGMMNIAGSVFNYVKDQFDNITTKMSTRQEKGKTYTYMRLPGSENYDPGLPAWAQDFVKYELGNDGKYYPVAIKEGNRERFGAFGVDGYGTFGQTSGQMVDILDAEGKSFEVVREIKNGGQQSVDIRDLSTGDILMFLAQNNDGTWNIVDVNSGYNFTADINKDTLLKAYQSCALPLSAETKAALTSLGINSDEFATLSYGLEIDPASQVLHTVPLNIGFNNETKAILAAHPELLDYYLKDYINYENTILNTPELGSELQTAALNNLLNLRSQLSGYEPVGIKINDFNTFRQVAITEVGSSISLFKQMFDDDYRGISNNSNTTPEVSLGLKGSVVYENAEDTIKSTVKLDQITQNQDEQYWVDNNYVMAYKKSELQILHDVLNDTWSMEGSIRVDGGFKLNGINSQVSAFGSATGKAEDIAAHGAGGVKIGGGDIDAGIHTLTTGDLGKVNAYTYLNDEYSNGSATVYSAYKLEWTTPLNTNISFEIKANEKDIEGKDPSTRTQVENTMKILNDLNTGAAGPLTPALENEVIDTLYGKIIDNINSCSSLVNTVTDNDKLFIKQAITDNIKSLSQINSIRSSSVTVVQDMNDKLAIMKIDTEIASLQQAQN